MLLSACQAPTFQITVQTPTSPVGGVPGRNSSITLGSDKTWTATNQGFGNPPKSGALDAKLGASVLAAAQAFLASGPDTALDTRHGALTITQNGTTGSYGFDAPAASKLRDLVLQAANTVPY